MAAVEKAIEDGTLNAFSSEKDDSEPEDCDCGGLDGFPSWKCVRAVREDVTASSHLTLPSTV
jgi:hypothetical protein